MNACSALKTIVPDQVCAFVGTGAYVEIPPDCTLFEGEPVTYTNLLAVLNKSDAEGGGSIPPGYTKLEYIESSGTQYLLPDVDVSSNLGCELKFSVTRFNMYVMEVRRGETRFTPAVCLPSSVIYGFGSYQTSFSYSLQPADLFVSRLNLGNSKKIEIAANGVLKAERTFSSAAFSIADDAVLLAQHRDGKVVSTGAARLYSAIFTEGVETVRDMVPVLDASGTPCMFDRVSKQSFYNSGTGSFIVGMTMRQLPALLHLPRVTSGELTLSLPWEAQLVQYGAPAILEEVKNRGWTLIVQYAEPDPESAVYNKYAACKTVADIAAVNPDFKNDLTIEKEWIYPTPSLERAGLASYKQGFMDSRAESVDFYAPIATELNYLFFSMPYIKKAHVYAPNATDISFCFRNGGKLTEVTGDLSNVKVAVHAASRCAYLREWKMQMPKLTDCTEMFYASKKLEDVQTEFPALEKGSNMFYECILNKESVIRIANSLPSYTSGTHAICFGIHIDHQNDEEVLAALEAVEAKGWTLTVQWNGTATVAAAATYGLRKPPIYAKIGTIEYPDGTTEKTLDWGHYVTNWEENGYTEFASLEEAYSHFNLTMPE